MPSHHLHLPTYRALLTRPPHFLTTSRAISTRPPPSAQEDPNYPNPLPTYARRNPNPTSPSPSPSPSSPSPTEGLALLTTRLARVTPSTRARTLRDISKSSHRFALERQSPRPWSQGEIYAPHDLSATEMQKRKMSGRQGGPSRDVFDILGIDPLEEYKNVAMMSEFCGPSGRVKGRRETGLRSVNQRRMARAVRRAVGLGLLPSVHAHPEMVERERGESSRRWFGERGVGGLLTRGAGVGVGVGM